MSINMLRSEDIFIFDGYNILEHWLMKLVKVVLVTYSSLSSFIVYNVLV